MKRRELLRTLVDCGLVFVREGAKHSIYLNPRTGAKIAIPRHAEVNEKLADKLIREACA